MRTKPRELVTSAVDRASETAAPQAASTSRSAVRRSASEQSPAFRNCTIEPQRAWKTPPAHTLSFSSPYSASQLFPEADWRGKLRSYAHTQRAAESFRPVEKVTQQTVATLCLEYDCASGLSVSSRSPRVAQPSDTRGVPADPHCHHDAEARRQRDHHDRSHDGSTCWAWLHGLVLIVIVGFTARSAGNHSLPMSRHRVETVVG